MALFQKTVIKKYSQGLDLQAVQDAYSRYQSYFFNPEIQQNIRDAKEEQFQEGFLRALFGEILGYTLNPNPNFNLTTELKNTSNSKKTDGAILIDNKAVAVIELKGTETTDLAKIETQAFGYKNNQPQCTYVIISNFEKLRFYIDNAIEYLEFNLFALTAEEFNLLWLCLSLKSIEQNIPKKIKEESLSQEDVITKRLYKDYSLFKRDLYQDLVALNPSYEPLELFRKSQKLLDRFLFIFFAEDRQLLPPNSVRLILNQWQQLKDLDADELLYNRFKKYFGYMNIGYVGKQHEVFAYNGGLFKPDEVLDAITITDDILYKHTLKLSEYDFVSEVDVNILGHIFENSLNELDEIKAEIEGLQIDKAKTKRKKDGVFYTPKYITKYIVENTVGKLCAEKKEGLELEEEQYTNDKRKTTKTKKELLDKLSDYRKWLLQLTICDPACGSGAFLNQALEFLINEHRYIDELQAKLFGSSLILSDVENSILENNLFGVDINEESVEIAQLSLWLRTARKNRKLNSLNNNIKCGNSLIDDPEVAGEKTFNWQNEFPQVFAKGGFDVVIGNPPYVNLEKIKVTSEAIEKKGYYTFNKKGDLYCVFVEKGFGILKDNGTISYIMPNKWLQSGYGKSLREYFLNYKLIQLIDFGDMQIFEGATTYPCIFISKKSTPEKLIKISTLKKEIVDFDTNVILNEEYFESSQLNGDTWVVSSNREKDLLNKLKLKFKSLSDFVEGEAFYGIKFGLTEAFLITDTTRDELIKKEINSSKIIGSILRGRNLKRYGTPNELDLDNIILASFGSYKFLENKFPSIHEYLLQFEKKLKSRGQCNGSKETNEKPFKGQHHWLELDNNPSQKYLDLYKKPKIMYQKFQVRPCFIYDEQGLYCNDSMWIIPTDNKALVAILNSKMGWWLINKFCTQIQNGYQLIWKYFGQIPIANTTNELDTIAMRMLSLNKELQEVLQKFQRTMQRKFELDELPKKLQDYYLLSYAEFIKELGKKKIKLSLGEEAEWEDYFNQESKKAKAIKAEIEATDKAIDQMVYKLYDITEEEQRIIEGK